MKPTIEIETEGARAFFNALAFHPARNMVREIRCEAAENALTVTGTDPYATGQDSTPCDRFHPLTWYMTREGVTEVEAYVRKSKSPVTLTLGDSEGSAESRDTDAETVLFPIHWEPEQPDLWAAVDELFTRLEPQGGYEGPVCLDPGLLSRFSKVKAPKGERAADFLIQGPSDPVLIKIGPTFRGMIQPIRRDVVETLNGEETLW